MVGLVIVAFFVLAGLPFGGDEPEAGDTSTTVQPITEGTVPPSNATISEVPTDDSFTITETMPPPLGTVAPPAEVTGTVAAPTSTVPPPVRRAPPPTAPQRDVRPSPPEPAPPARDGERPSSRPSAEPVEQPSERPSPPAATPGAVISESEATSVLRGAVAGYYRDVRADCTQIRSEGYRNVGYTFSVWDACNAGGGSRMLGRWRVDAKTREVFRQRENGRYLRP